MNKTEITQLEYQELFAQANEGNEEAWKEIIRRREIRFIQHFPLIISKDPPDSEGKVTPFIAVRTFSLSRYDLVYYVTEVDQDIDFNCIYTSYNLPAIIAA